MPGPPDVVLLRSADEQDPYVEAFAEEELRAVCVPVLRFAFPHQDMLRERLEERARYTALVVTSPRVTRALAPLFEAEPDLEAAWEGAPVYAVGPKTAAGLKGLGLRPLGANAGNADALAEQIVEEGPEASLLFLCGNRRRDTLPNRLREAGIPFDEQVVYETHLRTDLELPPATWLSFFSPSGWKAVQQSEVDLTSYRIAAIGPTTAGALRDVGLSVEAVADTPSPEGLVLAIRAEGESRGAEPKSEDDR